MFRLDGKVAMVTGTARGIGNAVARVLAEQGATVTMADLRMDEIEDLAARIGPAAYPYRVDVSSVSEINQWVDQVVGEHGRIDILVNNAGICPRLSFKDSTEADWEKLMSVNAKSQYFLMQAVCPVMAKQGGGRIVNIASTGARVGAYANASIYAGTKAAIAMFSKSVAREVAGDHILVNCVAPGVVNTDLMSNLSQDKVDAICETIPLNRLGKPEEIAAVVVLLASDECGFMTGATVDVNGGWVMV